MLMLPNDFILLDLFRMGLDAINAGDSDLVVACAKAMTARAKWMGWL